MKKKVLFTIAYPVEYPHSVALQLSAKQHYTGQPAPFLYRVLVDGEVIGTRGGSSAYCDITTMCVYDEFDNVGSVRNIVVEYEHGEGVDVVEAELVIRTRPTTESMSRRSYLAYHWEPRMLD